MITNVEFAETVDYFDAHENEFLVVQKHELDNFCRSLRRILDDIQFGYDSSAQVQTYLDILRLTVTELEERDHRWVDLSPGEFDNELQCFFFPEDRPNLRLVMGLCDGLDQVSSPDFSEHCIKSWADQQRWFIVFQRRVLREILLDMYRTVLALQGMTLYRMFPRVHSERRGFRCPSFYVLVKAVLKRLNDFMLLASFEDKEGLDEFLETTVFRIVGPVSPPREDLPTGDEIYLEDPWEYLDRRL